MCLTGDSEVGRSPGTAAAAASFLTSWCERSNSGLTQDAGKYGIKLDPTASRFQLMRSVLRLSDHGFLCQRCTATLTELNKREEFGVYRYVPNYPLLGVHEVL